MDVIGVVLFLTGFITMVVDGVDRGLITLEITLPEKTKKLLYYAISILLGLFLSLNLPQLSHEIFDGFYNLGDSLAGQIIIGVALGFGSKTVYYLIDWIKLQRQVSRAQVIAQAHALLAPPRREANSEE